MIHSSHPRIVFVDRSTAVLQNLPEGFIRRFYPKNLIGQESGFVVAFSGKGNILTPGMGVGLFEATLPPL